VSDASTRWELLEKLASGSYATVYRGRDKELNREVAVKVIREEYRENPRQLEQYWQEAQILASLHHPQIITIFDIDRAQGWLILELMQSNLAEWLSGRPMSIKSLHNTLHHALRALEYLHEQNIVHGDIKPTNLMFDHRRHVKVGDFGLARRVTDEDGSILKGTTKYIAPEVISDEHGPVGPASDLYSLGFTVYEFLCGSNFDSLFPGLEAFGRNKQMAWMMWHASKDRQLPHISRVLEGVPLDLQNVIDRLCLKDLSQRYGSASEALADLGEEYQTGPKRRASAVIASDSKDTDQKEDSSKKRLLLAAGVLAISLIMSMVMLFSPGGGPVPPLNNRLLKVGFVREVLVAQHKIVLENQKTGVPVEIDVGKTPRLFLGNEERYILLKDLQVGDRIQFNTSKTSTDVGSLKLIVSRPVESSGKIKQIDHRASKIIVAIQKGEVRGDIPLQITKTTQFQLNNKKSRLREMKVGDQVTIRHLEKLDSTGQNLQSLIAVRLMEAIGYITEVDIEQQQLTIDRPNGLLSHPVELHLSSQCSIKRAGQSVRLNDLKAKDRIRFQYDLNIHSIEVAAGTEQAKSILFAVYDDKNQFTIGSNISTEDLRYQLASNCDITLGQQPANLQDLRPNDKLTISYNPGKDEKSPRTAFSIDSVRNARFDRAAILIGSGLFQDQFLTPLPHTEEDLNLMYETLLNRYAVPSEFMLDLRESRQADIQAKLKPWLKSMNAHTQLIVYISGHAYTNSAGEVFFAPADFRFNKMEKTGISLNWLIQTLEKSASQQKTLLLDCTHAGTGADLKQEYSAEKMFEKIKPSSSLKTLHLIGSCKKGERGMLSANRQHGLFAHVLADGIGGAADLDKDLQISSTDLFNYLQQKMKTYASKAGQTQTPLLLKPH